MKVMNKREVPISKLTETSKLFTMGETGGVLALILNRHLVEYRHKDMHLHPCEILVETFFRGPIDDIWEDKQGINQELDLFPHEALVHVFEDVRDLQMSIINIVLE